MGSEAWWLGSMAIGTTVKSTRFERRSSFDLDERRGAVEKERQRGGGAVVGGGGGRVAVCPTALTGCVCVEGDDGRRNDDGRRRRAGLFYCFLHGWAGLRRLLFARMCGWFGLVFLAYGGTIDVGRKLTGGRRNAKLF